MQHKTKHLLANDENHASYFCFRHRNFLDVNLFKLKASSYWIAKNQMPPKKIALIAGHGGVTAFRSRRDEGEQVSTSFTDSSKFVCLFVSLLNV